MIHDHLLGVVSRAPATSGLWQGDSFMPYGEAAERIVRLAAGFAEQGIGPGSVVALLIPNSPEIFVIAHALFAAGAVAMPLGLTATRAELADYGRKGGMTAMIATPQFRQAA